MNEHIAYVPKPDLCQVFRETAPQLLTEEPGKMSLRISQAFGQSGKAQFFGILLFNPGQSINDGA